MKYMCFSKSLLKLQAVNDILMSEKSLFVLNANGEVRMPRYESNASYRIAVD